MTLWMRSLRFIVVFGMLAALFMLGNCASALAQKEAPVEYPDESSSAVYEDAVDEAVPVAKAVPTLMKEYVRATKDHLQLVKELGKEHPKVQSQRAEIDELKQRIARARAASRESRSVVGAMRALLIPAAESPRSAVAVKVDAVHEGSVGESVKSLQRTLNARLEPSPNLDVDGEFGPLTKKAVVRFQRDHNLEPSGNAGKDTWQALGELVPPLLLCFDNH